jgi:hypothetical protein
MPLQAARNPARKRQAIKLFIGTSVGGNAKTIIVVQ